MKVNKHASQIYKTLNYTYNVPSYPAHGEYLTIFLGSYKDAFVWLVWLVRLRFATGLWLSSAMVAKLRMPIVSQSASGLVWGPAHLISTSLANGSYYLAPHPDISTRSLGLQLMRTGAWLPWLLLYCLQSLLRHYCKADCPSRGWQSGASIQFIRWLGSSDSLLIMLFLDQLLIIHYSTGCLILSASAIAQLLNVINYEDLKIRVDPKTPLSIESVP